MSDSTLNATVTEYPPQPPSPGKSQTPPPPPSAMEDTVQDLPPAEVRKEVNPTSAAATAAASLPNVTFSIWPPSQRTRDAVVARLIETLSNPSVLSKRYGTMPHDEAVSVARAIEEEAFAAAGGGAAADDDGIEILQIYSKEISKRMLESVKSRAAAATPPATATPENGASQVPSSGGDTVSAVASEDISSTVESEA